MGWIIACKILVCGIAGLMILTARCDRISIGSCKFKVMVTMIYPKWGQM